MRNRNPNQIADEFIPDSQVTKRAAFNRTDYDNGMVTLEDESSGVSVSVVSHPGREEAKISWGMKMGGTTIAETRRFIDVVQKAIEEANRLETNR